MPPQTLWKKPSFLSPKLLLKKNQHLVGNFLEKSSSMNGLKSYRLPIIHDTYYHTAIARLTPIYIYHAPFPPPLRSWSVKGEHDPQLWKAGDALIPTGESWCYVMINRWTVNDLIRACGNCVREGASVNPSRVQVKQCNTTVQNGGMRWWW